MRCLDDKCSWSTSIGRRVILVTVAVVISETWPVDKLLAFLGIFYVGLSQVGRMRMRCFDCSPLAGALTNCFIKSLTKIFVSCTHAIKCSLRANINMHVKNASCMHVCQCTHSALILFSYLHSYCSHTCTHIALIPALVLLSFCTRIACKRLLSACNLIFFVLQVYI